MVLLLPGLAITNIAKTSARLRDAAFHEFPISTGFADLMFVPMRIDLDSAPVSQAKATTASFCEQKSCAAPRTL